MSIATCERYVCRIMALTKERDAHLLKAEERLAENEALRARVAALTRVAVAADDYWNGNGTSGAVLDALTEARAIGALPDAAPAGEGT